jgi:hypothetical protein
VHDRLPMYWNYGSLHGLCGVHLLRDLAGVADHPRHTVWAEQAAGVLRDAHRAAKTARADNNDRLDPAVLAAIETRWAHTMTPHQRRRSRRRNRPD